MTGKKILFALTLLFQGKIGVLYQLIRLLLTPRYQETKVNLEGVDLKIPDSASYISTYVELFEEEIYKFRAADKRPFIIDCGTNIGLSIIYFKKLYPSCRILGFEADKKIYKICSDNLAKFGYKDVKVINKGLWNKKTKLRFFAEGADGGRVAQKKDQTKINTIEMVSLQEYIDCPVDLLKMDIEGAEVIVLQNIRKKLQNVRNIFVEYHSFKGKEQELDKVLNILSEAGFRYFVSNVAVHARSPLINRPDNLGMDMQVNIWGIRE